MNSSFDIPFLTGTWLYSLTNNYTGPNGYFGLDVTTASDLYLKISSTPSTLWQFCTAPNPSQYNVCTNVTGYNMCLDIVTGKTRQPHLAAPEDNSRQQWTILPWGDGTYQMVNNYSQPDLHLDVYSDTRAGELDTGDHTGQHWTFNKAGDVQPSQFCKGPTTTASSSTVPSSTQASSQSSSSGHSTQSTTTSAPSGPIIYNPQREPVPLPAPQTSSSTTQQTGAYVGIAFGVALGLVSIFLIILWLLRRRRQRALRDSETPTILHQQRSFPPTKEYFGDSSVKSYADPDSEPVSAVEEIIPQHSGPLTRRESNWSPQGSKISLVETEGRMVYRHEGLVELPGQDWI
jgi:hypothetical protein